MLAKQFNSFGDSGLAFLKRSLGPIHVLLSGLIYGVLHLLEIEHGWANDLLPIDRGEVGLGLTD